MPLTVLVPAHYNHNRSISVEGGHWEPRVLRWPIFSNYSKSEVQRQLINHKPSKKGRFFKGFLLISSGDKERRPSKVSSKIQDVIHKRIRPPSRKHTRCHLPSWCQHTIIIIVASPLRADVGSHAFSVGRAPHHACYVKHTLRSGGRVGIVEHIVE